MQKIFIFENIDTGRDKEIYLNGISEQTKQAVMLLGGTKITSILLNEKYSKVKEWTLNRKPISLVDAWTSFQATGTQSGKLIHEVENCQVRLSCRYSKQRIPLPRIISEDLAYCIGLILGDGHLPNPANKRKPTWNTTVFFDNKEHQAIYDSLIEKEFSIRPAHYQRKPNCFDSCINSKVIHWFFSKYFSVHNGKKCNKIYLPDNILCNKQTTAAAIQGLFDSDGTITKDGFVKYATTSPVVGNQVAQTINSFGILAKTSLWIKESKYLPLHIISISKKSNKLFSEKIGFRHPLKKALLCQFV